MYLNLFARLPKDPTHLDTKQWVLILTIPPDAMDQWPLVYRVVAFLRYMGTITVGCRDGIVYGSESASTPLSVQSPLACSSYYFVPSQFYPEIQSIAGYVPIYFKDWDINVSSIPTGSAASPTHQTRLHVGARDGPFCQLCRGFQSTDICHLEPACRGKSIFGSYIRNRCLRSNLQALMAITKGDGAASFAIDGFFNLIVLCRSDHRDWDHFKTALVPFPNVAFDSSQNTLAYTDTPSTQPVAAVQRLILSPASVSQSHLSDMTLKGPSNEYSNWYPPEFLWSYKFGSALIHQWGQPSFKKWARIWTATVEEGDNGSQSDATTTGSSDDTGFSEPFRKRPRFDFDGTGGDKEERLHQWLTNVEHEQKEAVRGDADGEVLGCVNSGDFELNLTKPQHP